MIGRKREADRPTGKTALIILPPSDVCGFAEGYRQHYMPEMMHIIPPNVTLTDSFVPFDKLDGELPRLQRVLARVEPFPAALRGFATFPDQGILCLYLAHPERIIDLYQAVIAEFPEARAYEGKYGDDLAPLMTVGMFSDRDELFRVHKELEDQRLFIGWDVESVSVVYQVEGGEWRHWADMPLGRSEA